MATPPPPPCPIPGGKGGCSKIGGAPPPYNPFGDFRFLRHELYDCMTVTIQQAPLRTHQQCTTDAPTKHQKLIIARNANNKTSAAHQQHKITSAANNSRLLCNFSSTVKLVSIWVGKATVALGQSPPATSNDFSFETVPAQDKYLPADVKKLPECIAAGSGQKPHTVLIAILTVSPTAALPTKQTNILTV